MATNCHPSKILFLVTDEGSLLNETPLAIAFRKICSGRLAKHFINYRSGKAKETVQTCVASVTIMCRSRTYVDSSRG